VPGNNSMSKYAVTIKPIPYAISIMLLSFLYCARKKINVVYERIIISERM
jgi:hypothetical protein